MGGTDHRGEGFMKIQCEYCGQMIPETAQVCPHCGAANRRVKRTANGVPATMEELRAYCKAHNLPLQDMRVFIGENYRGARAFGIYRDETTGNFIVYKNKADGTRAVRYEGNDEAYAVNELYLKIKERVDVQKSHMGAKKGKDPTVLQHSLIKSLVFKIIILTMVFNIVLLFWHSAGPVSGYYVYQDHTYYYDRSDWYEWDDSYEEWAPTRVDSELKKNHDDYWESGSWHEEWAAGDFEESSWYHETEWEDDDWDYDWDNGDSWDSGYDDWDSDW